MIVKWLDFSDLHFEYTNVDTVNIRDNLLSTISDKELDADFVRKNISPGDSADLLAGNRVSHPPQSPDASG